MAESDNQRVLPVELPIIPDEGFFKQLTRKIFGKNEAGNYRQAIQEMLNGDEKGGVQSRESAEQAMLLNVLALRSLCVSDIMVPRADIIAVSETENLQSILEIFRTSEHSRLPVYNETLDNPCGFYHVKDALSLHIKKSEMSETSALKKILRNVIYIPGSISVQELLLKMQSSRVHIALVVDEYGGTDGMVTIEDLIEQVVGKINDEHDTPDAAMFIKKSEGVYEADARLELTELQKATGLKFTGELFEGEVDTLGGFITILAGRVPQRGELVEYNQYCEFLILDSDPKRIKRIRIMRTDISGG